MDYILLLLIQDRTIVVNKQLINDNKLILNVPRFICFDYFRIPKHINRAQSKMNDLLQNIMYDNVGYQDRKDLHSECANVTSSTSVQVPLRTR